MIRAWAAGAVLVIGIGLLFLLFDRWSATQPTPAQHFAATFVGSSACAACHATQTADWQRSQHRAAMAEPTEATVLGDFDDAAFSYGGVRSEFFRRDDRFFVRTDGPDGRLAEFEVEYTFGVYPLQQYLLALPGGRMQALSIAWDARPAAAGGQRWFHLYPGESVTQADELHWTRPSQLWNSMCADCHSTAVQKNYDASSDRFDTRWAEISVGCEACHGPGSTHVEWATAASGRSRRPGGDYGLRVQLDERYGVQWTTDAATGRPRRSRPRVDDVEFEICAQCHSRRTLIADGYEAGEPFLDFYRPVLLERPLYYADGQQRGEVYTWGSFRQSRMYARGVTCSDCHEPHSGGLRGRGNAVCTACHGAAQYDAPSHHHHDASSAGAACTACHMPATSYMVIDPRHDHSLRVPRPDLSAQYGTPNACNDCHRDRDAKWAASRVAEWSGTAATRRSADRVVSALAAADTRAAAAPTRLRGLARDPTQSAIVRATALAGVNVQRDPAAYSALLDGLHDVDPVVRLGSLQPLAELPPAERIPFAAALLSDDVRAVRIEAAGLLAGAAVALPTPAQRSAFKRAAQEFVQAQHYNADRADARVNLALFYADQGEVWRAEEQLEAAIRLDPFFVPAYVNLADLYREQARDSAGERVLRQGLERAPGSGVLHHALGLVLVRLHREDAALAALERAVALEPENARFAYVYSVALDARGDTRAAIAALERALSANPADPEILAALASYSAERGAAGSRR